MSALQLAVVLAPTALQLLWLRHLGAARGRVRQVARLLVYGAASAAAAGAVGTLAQGLLGLALAEGTAGWIAARCMLCVALVEELCKLLAARRVSERCRMETMLCCVLVAIGFDLAENLVYSITATMAVTVVRALKSVAGHTLYGAIMGLALGRAERAEKREGDATAWHMAAIAVPTALHGLYDLYTLPPSAAFASALTHCALGTVAAVMLVRRALGGRSAC
ncbi:MAG: PrsW family intramembrane metalloprotease [Atopobiaceae bacterium]|nr:PrsW family intramembrane metalloprotease [Atopobiaceae bacterium]